ncbi:MAG: hypothetical protein D3926_05345 [Desulfobacteraceae bacterium]|nr:MAG: hypothetical protein D3926_05345 [Desulfobacteraceae bacterium]
MSLRDYKSDFQSHEPDADDMGDRTAAFRDEINTLKIDKLSNRVTIISIIIPCLVGAILFFAYMDMKEKVTDVDLSKQSQVERISDQFDAKLNALDVKIAKNRFDYDKEIPELKKKATQIEGMLTKATASMADKKETLTAIKSLEKKIESASSEIKTTSEALKKSSKKQLTAMDKKQAVFEKKMEKQFKDSVDTLGNQINAKLGLLSELTDQLAVLKKQISIVDIRQKDLETKHTSTKHLEKQIADTKEQILRNIQVLETSFKKEFKVLDQKILNNAIKIQNPSVQSSTTPAQVPTTGPVPPKPIVEETIAE